MFFLPFILLATQLSAIAAAPLVARHNVKAMNKAVSATATASSAAATATAAATEEEKDGNTLDLTGVFDKEIALGGNNQKTDVLFTKGSTGALEVEFQDANANTLTVTENKNPGSAPSGFAFLEPSSFKIALGKVANNSTLQKVDFIFDPASAGVNAVDISKSKIGKLCTDTNTFVVDDALGEIEFEDDENEVTLSVKDLNGEWAILIPVATAAAGKEDKEGETDVDGKFDTAVETPAGNSKTDILFTPGVAGTLEVEVNATAANAVTVKRNTSPAAPPAGFLFVDPATFQISTASKTNTATDVVKVDYIFSPAVAASIDITKGVIGKLDTAKNTFITDPKELNAEFEVEIDENEWTLTVPDLNGEWAILIPESAVTKKATVLAL